MRQLFIQLLLVAVFVVPAFAGQGTIQETATQIIVEYSGGEEGAKAARARDAELEKQGQEENATEERKRKEEEERAKLHEQRMENAARKAERRGSPVQAIQE